MASAMQLRNATTITEQISSNQTNDEKEPKIMNSNIATRTTALTKLKREAEEATKKYEDALKAEIGTKLEYLATVALSVAWKMNAVRGYMTPHDQVPLGDLMWVRDRIEVKSVSVRTITIVRHLRGRNGAPVEMELPMSIISLSDRDMAKRVRETVRTVRAANLKAEISQQKSKENEALKAAEDARKKKETATSSLAKAEAWAEAKKKSDEKRKAARTQKVSV